MEPLRFKKIAEHRKDAVQFDKERFCSDPNCNAECRVLPTGDTLYDYKVICPLHGITSLIFWSRAYAPPIYVMKIPATGNTGNR